MVREGYLEGAVGVCAVDQLVQGPLGMIEHLEAGGTQMKQGVMRCCDSTVLSRDTSPGARSRLSI